MKISPLKKITITLTISTLLALAVLIFYLHYSLQNSATTQWINSKASDTVQLASWIDEEFTHAKKRLETIAQEPAFSSPPDAGLIDIAKNGIPLGIDNGRRQLLEWLLKEEHGFNVLFVLLPNGDHYISHPYAIQQSLKTYNLGHRPYFQEATKKKSIVISNAFVGADGVPAVAIDLPILGQDGNIHSHLGGVFYLSALTRLFERPSFSHIKETIYLVDKSGKLISHSEGEKPQIQALINAYTQDPNTSNLTPQAADSNYQAWTKAVKPRGNKSTHIVMQTRLQNGWELGVAVTEQSVVAQFLPSIWRTSALAAILLITLSGLGIYAVGRIGLRWQAAERQIEDARDQLENRVIDRTRELVDKEVNLRTTLNSIGDAVISTDLEGKIIGINPVAQAMTGWPQQMSMGKPLHEVFNIVDSETDEPIDSPVHQVLERGDTIELSEQTKLISKSGTEFQVADSAAPIRDADGYITGIVLVFRDVTEEYQMKSALKQSEERFRDFSNIAADMFWEMGPDLRFTYLSGRVDQVMGVNAEQVLGLTREELYSDSPFFHTLEFDKHLDDLNSHKPFSNLKVTWNTPDGELKHISVSGKPLFDASDNFLGYRGVSQDITKRKSTEEALRLINSRFQAILDYSPLLISTKDLEGNITLVNRHFEVLADPDEEQFVGKNIYDLFPYEIADALWKNDLEAQSGPIEMEEVALHRDGTEHTYWTTKFPLTDEAGELLGTCAISYDITERKQVEEALRRTQKMDAIGQLSGGIAHDFNNILGIIIGNLNLLKRRIPNDEQALRRIDIIKKSAERATVLTKQLLGFSSIQAAKMVTSDINRLISSMKNMIVRSLTPEVHIEEIYGENLWLTMIDPGDFEDALLNLLLNARDALQGSGEITLETKNTSLDEAYCSVNPTAKPGDYVQLTVSDNGVGIEAEDLERIFEPFYTTKPQGKGTGLGLAMVFGFVKRSGGYIKVYSEPSIGTSVKIYLPRAEGEDQPDQSFEEDSTLLPHGHETILVVDDEVNLAELAKDSLEILGYRVLTAHSGIEAIKHLESNPNIALLFSDVVMPGGINGFDLANKVETDYPDIKVLLTSGYTEKSTLKTGRSKYQGPLLNKPYTQDNLAQEIRTALDSGKAQVQRDYRSTPIQWDDSLNLGIEEINNDHKQLLSLLRRCQLAVQQDENIEVISAILVELEDYTQTHFRREEAIMENSGYPGLDNHRQVHQLLIKQTQKMRGKLDLGHLASHELLEFLSSWWIDHIQTMDRAYAASCSEDPEKIAQILADLEQAERS